MIRNDVPPPSRASQAIEPPCATLKAKLAIGGPEIVVASGVVGGLVPPTGTGVVLPTDPTKAGNTTLVSLSYVDIVAGGPPAAINDAIPLSGGFVFSAKKLVYPASRRRTPASSSRIFHEASAPRRGATTRSDRSAERAR
jgi:hypothetical protein